jgi:anti-sigma factor RsiW
MTCEEFVDSLRALRDEELTPADRIRAESYLTACEKCSAYVRGYERTIKLVQRTAFETGVSATLPEGLVRRILVVGTRGHCCIMRFAWMPKQWPGLADLAGRC